MWDSIKSVLRFEIVHTSDGVITVGSLALALLILLAGLRISKWIGRGIKNLLVKRGADEAVASAATTVVRYIVGFLIIMVSISSLGIDVNAILAASAVLMVGIGFGLQKVAENFISGLILLIERPVKVGDFIQVGGVFGTVSHIGGRATRVVTRDRVAVIVPNSELVTGQVVNQSIPSDEVRIAVKVGVAYGSDMAKVTDILYRVAEANRSVMKTPPPEVRFDSFGDSSLDMTLLVWIARPMEDLRISSELRYAIDTAFRENQVTIPFPQRDLHFMSVSPQAGKHLSGDKLAG